MGINLNTYIRMYFFEKMEKKRTVKDIVNEKDAGKLIFRLVMDLAISAKETGDGRLDFIARQFEHAIAQLWNELGKIEV